MKEKNVLTVTRSELAAMLNISENTAAKYLNPNTQRGLLPLEWLFVLESPIPHIVTEKKVAGKVVYLYPAHDYFPLCRTLNVKKLADTRPDVWGAYVAWVMGEYGIKEFPYSLDEIKDYLGIAKWVKTLPSQIVEGGK